MCGTNIFFAVKMKHTDKIKIFSTVRQRNVCVFVFEIVAWNESIVNSSVTKFLLSISIGSLTGSVIHANVLLND